MFKHELSGSLSLVLSFIGFPSHCLAAVVPPRFSPLVVQATKTGFSISIFTFQVALAEACPKVKDFKEIHPTLFLVSVDSLSESICIFSLSSAFRELFFSVFCPGFMSGPAQGLTRTYHKWITPITFY